MKINDDSAIYRRQYRGRVRAAVLDFSGTLIDAYVVAPAVVFVEVLKKHGVNVEMSEVRAPMGMRKDAHIEKLLEDPAIAARWTQAHGAAPRRADVQKLYAEFIPLQLACLAAYSVALPGAVDAVNTLRRDYAMRIAATSGFTRAMIDVILAETEKNGLQLDSTVGGDEVIHGSRPRPFMLYRALDMMNISPVQSVIKVDDSSAGIAEGIAAGCWTVGVSRYSNYMDIESISQAEKMSEDEINARHATARQILRQSAAHYVIDSVADLPEVVTDINTRLARGEQP